MSNYYYNEKKGRYEPASEAPFGVVPKEKRKRNVFTAEDYNQNWDDEFNRSYERERTMPDEGSSAGNWNTKVNQSMNKLDDILSQAMAQSTQSKTQGTSAGSYNQPKTTATPSWSSTSSTNQKSATQKSKFSVGLIIAVIWIFISVIKSCVNSSS